MNRALLAAGKPVRYVEVAGMGHGPSSDDEIQKVYSEIDLFLATHLSDKPAATGAATH
jgi:dipeptidyl aminopeptidase/acylaminoacyl peptidase